jgi:hypothetical protein
MEAWCVDVFWSLIKFSVYFLKDCSVKNVTFAPFLFVFIQGHVALLRQADGLKPCICKTGVLLWEDF